MEHSIPSHIIEYATTLMSFMNGDLVAEQERNIHSCIQIYWFDEPTCLYIKPDQDTGEYTLVVAPSGA